LISGNQLAEMSDTDITRVGAETLVDIGSIRIDASLPSVLRMESYLKQIKNPYCFLCENTPVKIGFASGGGYLEDKLLDYFIGLKSR
jgi:hypothetical protein